MIQAAYPDLTLNPNIAVVITAILPYSGSGVCNVLETHAHKHPHITRWTLGAGTLQRLDRERNVVREQPLEEGQWAWVEEGELHRLKPRTEQWAFQCEHWDHDVLDIEAHASEAA
jgi:hypothetical protein